MRARILSFTDRSRPAPPRRGHATTIRPAADRAVFAPEPADPEERVREAGGPEDYASYTCTCGYLFDAAVSTSVACPHCGTAQAW